MNSAHDLKSRLVTWGITVLFILEFGKFLVVQAWEIVKPLFHP